MINYNFSENTLLITDTENDDILIKVYRKGLTDSQLKIKGQEALNNLEYSKYFDLISGQPVRDDAYMNGTLARSDYTITTAEGQAIKTKLLADWSDEVEDYENSNLNLVSEYSAEREPYINDSISWYSFGNDLPPESVREAYSLSDNEEDYRGWYGLKFDKTTKNVLCKAVYTNEGFIKNKGDDIIVPNLPYWLRNRSSKTWDAPKCFYAMIHDKSGNTDEHYDIYFKANEHLLKEWCEDNGITFSHTADISDKIMLYGMTIKGTTGEIKYVKAYTRYYL